MDAEFDPDADGTVNRVDGEVPASGLNVRPRKGQPAFESAAMLGDSADRFNRLTLVLLQDIGQVYLRGNGVVQGKQGEAVTLGNAAAKPSAAAPAN